MCQLTLVLTRFWRRSALQEKLWRLHLIPLLALLFQGGGRWTAGCPRGQQAALTESPLGPNLPITTSVQGAQLIKMRILACNDFGPTGFRWLTLKRVAVCAAGRAGGAAGRAVAYQCAAFLQCILSSRVELLVQGKTFSLCSAPVPAVGGPPRDCAVLGGGGPHHAAGVGGWGSDHRAGGLSGQAQTTLKQQCARHLL